MKRVEHGFTLLEVMAAIAIVAIVFTTLARVASQGLRSEGTSKRRLEASLLADATLADIEGQLAGGIAPEIGSTEVEEEEFTVTTEVSPFDLAAAIPTDDEGEAGAVGGVLSGPSTESPLRQIEITVAWTEGLDELYVTRTYFGIDQAAVEDLLNAAVAAQPTEGGGEATR